MPSEFAGPSAKGENETRNVGALRLRVATAHNASDVDTASGPKTADQDGTECPPTALSREGGRPGTVRGRAAPCRPSPTLAISSQRRSSGTPSGCISGSPSYRDVKELLAERGIETSYETVRRWVLKFGPLFARKLRRLRPRPMGTWHLDEMVTLSAKSGCDQLQGRKARHTGPSAWTPLQPAHDP
jgi:hypothetical protein